MLEIFCKLWQVYLLQSTLSAVITGRRAGLASCIVFLVPQDEQPFPRRPG